MTTTAVVTVRDFDTAADAGVLLDLFCEIARDAYVRRPVGTDDELRQAMGAELKSHTRHWRIFLAEADGVVIGFSSARKPPSASRISAHFTKLAREGRLMSSTMAPSVFHARVSIYVRPGYRRQGAGWLLLTHAADYLRDSGMTVFRAHAAGAGQPRLFRRFGGYRVDVANSGLPDYEIPLGGSA